MNNKKRAKELHKEGTALNSDGDTDGALAKYTAALTPDPGKCAAPSIAG